jgi:hypothetical protein
MKLKPTKKKKIEKQEITIKYREMHIKSTMEA